MKAAVSLSLAKTGGRNSMPKIANGAVITKCGECSNCSPSFCGCYKDSKETLDTIDPQCPLQDVEEVKRDLLIPLRQENDFDFTCRYGHIKFDDIEKIIIVKKSNS